MTLSLFMFVDTATSADKPLNPKQQSRLLQKLQSLWKQRRQEIKTAEIRYRMYRNETSAISRNDFNALIDGLDLASTPDAMRDVIQRLHVDPIDAKHPWGTAFFYKDGSRMKEVLGSVSTQVTDGTTKIEYDPANRYAHVTNATQSRMGMGNLRHFRFLPIGTIRDCITSSRSRDSIITVVAGKGVVEYQFHVDTGLLQRSLVRNPKGSVIEERRELGFARFPGGVRFPKVVIEATFASENGTLRFMKLVVIEEARFNHPLSDDVFKIKTNSIINVRDTRDAEGRVRTIIGLPPTTDLEKAIEKHPESPAVISVWLIIVATVIGVALFAGGVFLMRTRSRSKP